MIIAAIKPNMLPLVWPTVSPMLERAIDHSHNELSIDDIYNRALKGDMLILTAGETKDIFVSLAIEKRVFSTGKEVLNVTLAGGDRLSEWMPEVDKALVKLAKDYDCEEIYIVGRNGWDRKFKQIGYGRVHTVVSKKVGE